MGASFLPFFYQLLLAVPRLGSVGGAGRKASIRQNPYTVTVPGPV